MLEVREILVSEHFGELAALARDHWLETERGISDEGPKPSEQIYAALEGAGNLLAFAAFEGDTLVGYVVGIFSTHLHYGFPYVAHDLLYVDPTYRRGSLGLKLMRAMEHAARRLGAKFITWHAKPGTNFDDILIQTGCSVEETVYKKEL